MTQYICLDGRKMSNRHLAVSHLKEQLKISKNSGHNLDALFDELSSQTCALTIILENSNEMKKNLGNYSTQIIKMLSRLEKCKQNITFEIVDSAYRRRNHFE